MSPAAAAVCLSPWQERGCLQQSQLPAFLSCSVPLEQLLGPKCKKVEHLAQVQDFLINEKQVGPQRLSCSTLAKVF
jgi:hypothetical protein